MNDCVETANGGCESCVNDLVLSPVGMMTLEEENTFGSIIFYQYIYCCYHQYGQFVDFLF